MKAQKKNKRKVALLLCGFAAAFLALLPFAMFAVTDAALLQKPRESSTVYTSITPQRDSFYLIRLLYSRAVNAGAQQQWDSTEKANFYLAAQTMRSEMRQDGTLCDYAFATLDALQRAGVVPSDWASAITQSIGGNTTDFYVSTDTLGFITISYFESKDGDNAAMPYSVTIESKTGAVTAVWLSSNKQYSAAKPETALPALVKMAGLSSLNDWRAPKNTDYAQSGLFSASGGLLATCVTGEYGGYDSKGTLSPRYYYNIILSPMQPERLQDMANAGYSTDTSFA
ncbi:MAG: hypothetical protein RSG59_08060 [Ruthenibacterium sp.]